MEKKYIYLLASSCLALDKPHNTLGNKFYKPVSFSYKNPMKEKISINFSLVCLFYRTVLYMQIVLN